MSGVGCRFRRADVPGPARGSGLNRANRILQSPPPKGAHFKGGRTYRVWQPRRRGVWLHAGGGSRARGSARARGPQPSAPPARVLAAPGPIRSQRQRHAGEPAPRRQPRARRHTVSRAAPCAAPRWLRRSRARARAPRPRACASTSVGPQPPAQAGERLGGFPARPRRLQPGRRSAPLRRHRPAPAARAPAPRPNRFREQPHAKRDGISNTNRASSRERTVVIAFPATPIPNEMLRYRRVSDSRPFRQFVPVSEKQAHPFRSRNGAQADNIPELLYYKWQFTKAT